MNIYNYDLNTYEYTCRSIADESPLEPNIYLLPAYSTEIKPPETSVNETAVFSEIKNQWSVVADYRNIELWNKETAQKITAVLGETPADINATPVKPMVDYPKWDEITSSWFTDETAQLSAQKTTATCEVQQLLSIANDKIVPLQDAVDLGIATDAETISLTKWKTYRVLVNRVPTQPGFPTAIDWPSMPE